jgi:alpha-tubulin suppressor-like RCC1 family protein
MDGDRFPRRGTPSARAARPFGVSPPMEWGRTVVLAMTMALLLAVAGQADGATTQEGRTTDRGTTNASAADGPQGVTTLRAWGNNYEGQLGDETNGNNRTRPVKVRGLRGAKVEEIAAGQMHTLALEEDGTVLAWGYNRDGELGDGTNQDNPAPVQVKDFRDPSGRLSGVRAVAAGSVHSLALKDDGTVWAWGYHSDDQLGDGTKANSTRPVRVRDLEGVEAVAAGAFFSLALKEDGSVWAWGANTSGQGNKVSGQLGEDAVSSSDEPVEVVDLGGGVEEIVAGASHVLALKEDGTVWAWGANDVGQLGNGTEGNQPLGINTPLEVKGLSGVELLAAGLLFSFAGSK